MLNIVRRSFARAPKNEFRRFFNSDKNEAVGVVARYNQLLITNPLVTKGVTSGLIVGFGDALCQVVIEDGKFDLQRMLRMGFLGTFLVAPALHVWYGYLHRLIPSQTTMGAVQRLALDQTVFGPSFIPVFFGTLFTLEGRPHELVPYLRENYIDTVFVNWKLWIPGNFINFRFVPPQFQVLWANAVALVWNTYLSWSSHKDEHAKTEA